MALIIEIIAETMLTYLKLVNKRIALITGNINKADISKDPTRFIANTTTIAIITAISRL